MTPFFTVLIATIIIAAFGNFTYAAAQFPVQHLNMTECIKWKQLANTTKNELSNPDINIEPPNLLTNYILFRKNGEMIPFHSIGKKIVLPNFQPVQIIMT